MKTKEKNPDKLGFKSYLGTTLMGTTDSLGAGIMSGLFMMYLTDYAGIGKWGAILGTTLLMVARLFDAVNDPLEGWIMDRSKVGKYGKYRPFILLSILMSFIGVTGLFALPSGTANSPVIICVWVLFFYLLYDMGASFYAPNLVYRTMTLDPNERGKLLVGLRMYGMFISMLCASFLAIINGINKAINNMHTAFAITVGGSMILTCAISVIGLALIRERHHVEREKRTRSNSPTSSASSKRTPPSESRFWILSSPALSGRSFSLPWPTT